MPDSSLTIYFFGIKNDRSRSGFEVNIPANANVVVMNPLSCLRAYIDRTVAYRPTDTNPLFIT